MIWNMLSRGLVSTDIRRRLLLTVYGLFALAGPLAIVWTPPVIEDSFGEPWSDVWGAYILICGLGCLIGCRLDKWIGEFTFIHLLGSALFVYAIAALAASEEDTGRVVSGVLIFAATLLLLDRWLEVRSDARDDTGAVSKSRE